MTGIPLSPGQGYVGHLLYADNYLVVAGAAVKGGYKCTERILLDERAAS